MTLTKPEVFTIWPFIETFAEPWVMVPNSIAFGMSRPLELPLAHFQHKGEKV